MPNERLMAKKRPRKRDKPHGPVSEQFMRHHYGARKGAPAPTPEIRLNADGSLDEVVAKNCTLHLEQMDYNHWWLAVECGGKWVSVWLHAKGKITATYESEQS